MMNRKKLQRIAAVAAMSGGLAFGALGLGTGVAFADEEGTDSGPTTADATEDSVSLQQDPEPWQVIQSWMGPNQPWQVVQQWQGPTQPWQVIDAWKNESIFD